MAQDENGERGFRPIGNLLPRIGSSLPGSDSTPNSSLPIATTTGARSQTALRLVKSTGRELTVIDVENSLRAKVEQGNPAKTNAMLEMLLRPFVSLSWRGIPTDDPYTTYAEQRLVIERHDDGADRWYIRRLLEASMHPPERTELIKALGRLRLLTTWRASSSDEGALIFAVFADELAEWPSDAVLTALKNWPRTHKFWPTLSELLDEVKGLCQMRTELLEIFR
jgi:hypothetical protein